MPLPPGYTLDQAPTAAPNLPPGYKLDTPSAERPTTSGSVALDFMQGGGAELIGTALGAYNLLRKIPGADKVLPPVSPEVQQYAEPPHTVAAKLGGLFTMLGEFAVPGGEAAGLTKGAGLVARAGAQAGAAGAVQAARSGGDVSQTIDAAALGAAGPVAGAVLGAGARAVAPVLAKAPGLAADVVGLAQPRAAHLMRIGIRAAKAAGSTAEEAAPAEATVSKTAGQLMAEADGQTWGKLSADDKLNYEYLAKAPASTQAAASQATPRPPEYYGVKAAEVPPTNPAPSAPTVSAQPASAAAPAAKVTPIRPEPTQGSTQGSEPQPKPDIAGNAARSYFAKAKSQRYADAIGKWAEDRGISPSTAAEGWESASPETRGRIILQMQRKGYLGPNETIPNTSAAGIIEALKAKTAQQ